MLSSVLCVIKENVCVDEDRRVLGQREIEGLRSED
jgi:hypothetical protein